MPPTPEPISLLDPAALPLGGDELLALVQAGRTLRCMAADLTAPPPTVQAGFRVLTSGAIGPIVLPIGLVGDVPGSDIDAELEVDGDVLLLATFELDRHYDPLAPFGEMVADCHIAWNTPNGPVAFGRATVASPQLHPCGAPGNPMNYGPSERQYVTGFFGLPCNAGPVHFHLACTVLFPVADMGLNRVAGLTRLVAVLPTRVLAPASSLLGTDAGDILTSEGGDVLITEGG